MQFLNEYSDENNPVAIPNIIAYLAKKGITASHKTVMQDIEMLIEADIDVVSYRSRQYHYFIGERHFEMPEVKLLIDAVLASKFLSPKRGRSLADKLLALVSVHQRVDLSHGLEFDDHVKPTNNTAYITADMLLKAINSKKQIRFMYYEYSPAKKKLYKHGRRCYEFSPWAFVWNNDSYYVIGHSKHHDKTVTFRVDRIAAPKLTDIDSVQAPDGFELSAYIKSVFQMYDGSLLDVTLKCENSMMKTIIDRFGEDVHTEIADNDYFMAKVNVSASKTFYGWIFAMDGAIRITAPNEAVDEFSAMLCRQTTCAVDKTR